MKHLTTTDDGYNVFFSDVPNVFVVACPLPGHETCGYTNPPPPPNPITAEYKSEVARLIKASVDGLRTHGCNVRPAVADTAVADAVENMSDEEKAALIAEVKGTPTSGTA